MQKHNCANCGQSFDAFSSKARFCSKKCRTKKYVKNNYNPKPYKNNLPTPSIGAMSELLVCANLLSLGYKVFRSVSPSCPYDLIADKNTKLLKIEVKTGYYSKLGKLIYPKPKPGYDILAVSTGAGVVYIPPLESVFGDLPEL